MARVAEFVLSLNAPQSEYGYRSMKAVGTVGYIDPEYYSLNILTLKSHIYRFRVVLLELLTGKKAIIYSDDREGRQTSLVNFAVPLFMSGEFVEAL